MPYLSKDQVTSQVIPIFVKAMKDPIPNVRFTVAKIIHKMKSQIEPSVMQSSIVPGLKELGNDSDRDV